MRASFLFLLVCIPSAVSCGGGDDTTSSGSQGSGGSGATGGGSSSSTNASTGPGGSTGSSSSSSGSGGGQPVSGCPPLPAPAGNIIEVMPSQTGQLPGIVLGAQSGDTILLQDGTYLLDGATLQLAAPGITLRSKSGNRDAVLLDGNWTSAELIAISASDVTVADLTVARAYHHPIHVYPGASDVTGTRLYNLYVLDPGQQAIKINANGAQTLFVDDGTIACSRIELTGDGRAHVQGCYTGGIDAHRARGLRIHDNTIIGFWCTSGLSEHGIHLWTGSRDTLIERNRILDCARGIGLGLGDATPGRTYPDDPCPGVSNVGHYGGIVRNNFVVAAIPGFDSGISLEQACGASVLHNTVASENPPFSSIEWRFSGTTATVTNNLVSHNLRPRDGAQAMTAGNIEQAPYSLFVDAAAGDVHLAAGANAAIDQGVPIAGGLVTDDIDGDARDSMPDVGADERVP